MSRSNRDMVRTVIQSIALGIVVVALGCLALRWLQSPGADWFWTFWG